MQTPTSRNATPSKYLFVFLLFNAMQCFVDAGGDAHADSPYLPHSFNQCHNRYLHASIFFGSVVCHIHNLPPSSFPITTTNPTELAHHNPHSLLFSSIQAITNRSHLSNASSTPIGTTCSASPFISMATIGGPNLFITGCCCG